MKQKPRWTLEMFTAGFALLAALFALALLMVQPAAWPVLLALLGIRLKLSGGELHHIALGKGFGIHLRRLRGLPQLHLVHSNAKLFLHPAGHGCIQAQPPPLVGADLLNCVQTALPCGVLDAVGECLHSGCRQVLRSPLCRRSPLPCHIRLVHPVFPRSPIC